MAPTLLRNTLFFISSFPSSLLFSSCSFPSFALPVPSPSLILPPLPSLHPLTPYSSSLFSPSFLFPLHPSSVFPSQPDHTCARTPSSAPPSPAKFITWSWKSVADIRKK
ncbi:hypothetical protein E2C01_007260 [Portunus trituberculatus]|uniref:Uncharacterized protein n=1 Tax=Portunus trituberculatus TaxID=210409 RepID=A0A5B7D3W1_PORTR|nr:hypothetical protein [Portunus trituberculatus]